MIEFTQEELQALKFWLSVIQFQGTREQIQKPLEVYDAVVGKIEGALAARAQEETCSETLQK